MKWILCALFFFVAWSPVRADEDFLQNRITLQAKNMKAEFMLQKLAEATPFNLILNDDFPRNEKVTVDAKNFPLSRMLDIVAESTHTHWTLESGKGAKVIKFEKKS